MGYNEGMEGGVRDRAEVFETILDMSYTTRIVVGRHDLTLITEKLPYDRNSPKLVSFESNAYEKDKVVYRVRKEFSEDIDIKDASQIQRVMDFVHKEAINELKAGKGIRKEAAAYLKAIKAEIKQKKYPKAFNIAKEAYQMHPGDPMILTYYGYLSGKVEKKFKTAVEACEKAINLLPRKLPSGLDSKHRPRLYFHLSRVYQAAGKRNEAVNSLYRGIGYDEENGILHKELERIGVRRRPVIPFMSRDNFLNIWLGKLRHRILGPKGAGLTEDE